MSAADEGGRTVRIRDVAQAAGVSTATVSFVLSGKPGASAETRARVLAVIEELGYRRNRHAKALRTGHRPSIAIILPDITNPFFADVVVGAEEAARERDWDVVLFNLALDPERERRYLARAIDDADGIVYLPLERTADADDATRAAVAAGPPLVVVDEVGDSFGVGSVAVDNRLGGRLVAEHFAEGGRTRAATIGAPLNLPSSALRVAGFIERCREIGIEVLDQDIGDSGRSVDEAVAAALTILERDRAIDCFFAGNDVVAFRLLMAVNARGIRVPDDLAVAGFDGLPWGASSSPSLTSVRQPAGDMGRAAVEIIVSARASAGPLPWTARVLPVSLVVRDSSRKA